MAKAMQISAKMRDLAAEMRRLAWVSHAKPTPGIEACARELMLRAAEIDAGVIAPPSSDSRPEP